MTDQLRAAARDGVGVLLVSTELDEILALADRILVIFRGRIIGEMANDRVDPERLGLLMGGRVEEPAS
jgi:simple sugar transport system ATP-binding protein